MVLLRFVWRRFGQELGFFVVRSWFILLCSSFLLGRFGSVLFVWSTVCSKAAIGVKMTENGTAPWLARTARHSSTILRMNPWVTSPDWWRRKKYSLLKLLGVNYNCVYSNTHTRNVKWIYLLHLVLSTRGSILINT